MDQKKINKRQFGSEGEKAAADYLVNSGYEILARNYRVGKLGEIDIVGCDGEYICFVEVKTRTSLAFGLPSEAVTKRKQEKIIRLAQIFINQHRLQNRDIRFDIVEVVMNKGRETDIHLIKNAF